MHAHAPIVLIGTGLAGYNLAKEFRKLSTHPLVLITQDDGHFYSKPQLSIALQNKKTAQDLIITPCEQMQQQLDAPIHAFSSVTHIDFAQKVLTFTKNESEHKQDFSQLVFAMGSQPKPLPLFKSPHYRINSLLDYSRFRNALSDAQSILIVGSGLVGCEFAHDLTFHAKKVDIVSPDTFPLSAFVPEVVGKGFQHALANQGVTWHLQTVVTAEQAAKYDLTLIAIGLTPSTLLAQRSGIHVNQGIVVDDYLQTNMPGCYALGDCAEINQTCRQFIAPILQCARALAKTLAGEPTKALIPAMPIALKTSLYPIITVPVDPKITGNWEFDIYPDGINAQFFNNAGTLLGYCLSGSQTAQRQQLAAKLNNKALIA